jgi:hypothetical protein
MNRSGTKHAQQALTSATHYRYALHTRRISRLALISSVVLGVALIIIVLSFLGVAGISPLVVPAYLVGVIAFVVLLPMLFLTNEYRKSGIWLDSQGVRAQFPAEKPQQMTWSEARFAVNEGEEYLRASKGKEGLGHVVGDTRYIRLHLEGLFPEERQQAEADLAAYLPVRAPLRFTLMTLLNSKGDIEARGRLYLFEGEALVMENRGEKRVFFDAPLKDLSAIRQRDPFYIGKLECEAFSLRYKGQDYTIMLGYETVISGNIGNSSHWSATGYAREWVAALSPR